MIDKKFKLVFGKWMPYPNLGKWHRMAFKEQQLLIGTTVQNKKNVDY